MGVLELRHLKTFKVIADVGGFTRAAEHLGYAQSTITSHIQALEEELGSPIFDRLGKKVVLTQTGKYLMPYAIEILNLHGNAKKISTVNDEISGSLIIGATESLTVYRLPEIIHEYKKQYPHVHISLKPAICNELRNNLRNGEIDIAFLLESERLDPDLYIEKLIDEPMVLVVQDNHLFTNYSFDLPETAINKTILYTEQGCSYRDHFDIFLRNQGISTETALEFGSVEAIKQCVISGLGVSLLPLITVQSEINERKLVAIPWNKKDGNIVTSMAYHKNKWISPALKMFIQIVRKHASSWS